MRLEAQRGALELQGLQSHDVPWTQERALLQQEVRLFRRNTIIFYMKLRWILMHWRLGRKDDSREEMGHQEVSRGFDKLDMTVYMVHTVLHPQTTEAYQVVV